MKLIGSLLAFAAAATAYLVEYRWHDRRTAAHRRGRWALLTVVVLAGVHALVLVVLEQRDNDESHAVDTRDRQKLLDEVSELRQTLAPLAVVAQRAFPELGRDEALARLPTRISELETQVSDMRERGRKEDEDRTSAEERKKVPPQVTAGLSKHKDGYLVVVIQSANGIPFEASWMVTTTANRVVSGIMLGKEQMVPTANTRKWLFREDIQDSVVQDEFLELSLSWTSAHYDELQRPDELKGEVRQSYRYRNGELSYWEGSTPTPGAQQ